MNSERWTVPADRVKRGIEHVVPLSEEAIEVFAKLPRGNDSDLLFLPVAGGAEHLGTLVAEINRPWMAKSSAAAGLQQQSIQADLKQVRSPRAINVIEGDSQVQLVREKDRAVAQLVRARGSMRVMRILAVAAVAATIGVPVLHS